MATALFGGEDNKKWCGEDDGEGEELERCECFTEKKPAEDEVEDRRELSEDADVGGIVEFEGAIVGDAREARE